MTDSRNVKSISSLVTITHDKEKRNKQAAHNRNQAKLKQELFHKSSLGRHEAPWGNPMKMIKVSSNYARDRVVMIAGGQLVLTFDHQGLAELPEHLLPLLKSEMRVRPGRYHLHLEAPTAPVVEPVDETKVAMREQVENLLKTLTAKADSEPVEEEDEEESPMEVDLELESELTEEE